ncbi:glycine betaine/L-proline ABC transporter ATP-binding protein [Chloroflexota bacterium]
MPEEKIEVLCQNLWKIFGPHPESVLDLASNGVTKQEVLEQTGHVIAVKDVSFEVRENESFVIMGLSGSGKSTLVRCINRLIEPTMGKIIIDEADLAQMSNDELKELRRHKLSMVFQNFGLLPHRSVQDNVAFGLEVRGENRKNRRAKVIQALEMVGLKGWEKSPIHELSGGMQQRVGLARALAIGAEILLMDEPFSALDPLIRRQMQDEFINLRATVKRTVVFITHDLLEALKLGDRVAIMKDGVIVQIGTPKEIVSQPADDYVSEFVKDVPRGKVISVESIMEQPTVSVTSDRNLQDVIEEMMTKQDTTAFVVDTDGRLKGVVTMEEATESVQNEVTRAGDAVKEEYNSISPDTPVEQCLSIAANDIPVVVLDDDKHLLGVITRQALIAAMQSDNGTAEKK